MRIWSPEGFLDLDFAKKTLTLMQPSDMVRRHEALDMQARPCFASRVQGSTLSGTSSLAKSAVELASAEGPDGLTRELQEFVRCVRTNSQPRVRGEEGRDAAAGHQPPKC